MSNENYNGKVVRTNEEIKSDDDRLFVTVVSTSDYHAGGLGFDPRLYPTNFSRRIGSRTVSTQLCEDNRVAN